MEMTCSFDSNINKDRFVFISNVDYFSFKVAFVVMEMTRKIKFPNILMFAEVG